MNDDNYNYRNKRQSGGDSTFFAFMTGLALGAVAALLSNPDHREKVRRTFQDVQNKGEKMLSDTTKKAQDMTQQVTDTVSKEAEQLAKNVQDRAKEVRKK